jgi:condensin complex subunit 2
VSALARANGRRSLGATLNAAGAGGAAQHERDGREITKLTVDSTSFEEWMKMATDNKINATNTWNFALIDYFHDMSLLRSDNGDGSINFQKASCTLDGCVKVWTSRVDSVVVETGKLLSGLQDDGKETSKNSRARNADDEDGAEGGDDEDDVDGQGPRRKRSRAKEPTLAKNFTQLAVKKLDLEFTVDPLFKKTSADFDEGGAGGLLMNHLGVDSRARIVFDASDVPGQDDADEEAPATVSMDEEEMPDDEEMDTIELVGRASVDQQETVDISKLRGKLFGQHDVGNADDALSELLNGMTVCPTFSSFRFAPDDNTPFSALMADNEAGPAEPLFDGRASSAQSWEMPLDDYNLAFDAEDDDGLDDAFGFSGGLAGPSSNLYDAAGDAMDFGDAGFDDAGPMGGEYGFNEGASARPAAMPIDFTTSLQGLLEGSADQHFEGDDFFGYFDQKMSKNWAGPEHWKMRNVVNPNNPLNSAKASAAASAANRKSKEPFVIDFVSPEGAITSKELFEKPSSSSATLLPSSKEETDVYLLPEDRHFSSKKLLRLFIKPRAILNPRRTGQLLESRTMPRSDLDADYWIQAAAQNGGAQHREGGAALSYDADEGGMPEVPFDTQFFHEDDGGFDPMDDVEGGEHALALEQEDEELVTQALKRIRPEFVNYAKKAKRVDVRKLKENIWRELAIVVKDSDDASLDDEEEEKGSDGPSTPKVDDVDMALESVAKRDPTDPRTFDNVLSGLRKLYSKDRMDEISTSFCFICLLHLANEEGLRIKTVPDGIGGLGMLAGRAIVEEDEEEDEDDDDMTRRPTRMTKSNSNDVFSSISSMAKPISKEAEDADLADFARVGFLEQLSIAKDPNAGRSA